MKTPKPIIAAAAVVLALVLSMCCPCRRSASITPLTGTAWRLTQLEGAAVASATGYRMTLASDGRIAGVGDCNHFTGTFTTTPGSSRANGTFRVAENLVSTRMMCPDQARENKFLGMLRSVDSYSIDGARLLLIRGGDVLAILEVDSTL